MKKISGSTLYYKKVFPMLWFGLLALYFITSLITGVGDESLKPLIMPPIIAVIGYAIFRKTAWVLADEVYDYGDFLEFHKGRKTQRVPLNEITNIGYSHISSPQIVIIHTRHGGAIGKEIAFSLAMRINPLSKNPQIRELIKRVYQARKT